MLMLIMAKKPMTLGELLTFLFSKVPPVDDKAIYDIVLHVLVNWLQNLMKAKQLRSLFPHVSLKEVCTHQGFLVYDVEANHLAVP